MSKLYPISALILIAILAFVTYSFSKPSNTNTQTSSLNTNSLSTNMMNNTSMVSSNSTMMNMSDSVKDDQSFLENMIPHHQEAVDSSNQVLNSTTDPELKTFVQNVISAQTKEIGEMKTWYKIWFNKDYTLSANYQVMMSGMKGKTGIELDQAYVQGMIMHHQGAIQIATKIQTITKRPELLKLASDIITSQTKERTILMKWMMSKYNDHSMMGI